MADKLAIILRPDGWEDITIRKDHELSDMQTAVGGYIQLVPVADETLSCFCNEEGKIIELEPNPAATNFVGDHLFDGDYVAGNFLIMGRVDRHGNTLGLAPKQHESVTEWLKLAAIRGKFTEVQ